MQTQRKLVEEHRRCHVGSASVIIADGDHIPRLREARIHSAIMSVAFSFPRSSSMTHVEWLRYGKRAGGDRRSREPGKGITYQGQRKEKKGRREKRRGRTDIQHRQVAPREEEAGEENERRAGGV